MPGSCSQPPQSLTPRFSLVQVVSIVGGAGDHTSAAGTAIRTRFEKEKTYALALKYEQSATSQSTNSESNGEPAPSAAAERCRQLFFRSPELVDLPSVWADRIDDSEARWLRVSDYSMGGLSFTRCFPVIFTNSDDQLVDCTKTGGFVAWFRREDLRGINTDIRERRRDFSAHCP